MFKVKQESKCNATEICLTVRDLLHCIKPLNLIPNNGIHERANYSFQAKKNILISNFLIVP